MTARKPRYDFTFTDGDRTIKKSMTLGQFFALVDRHGYTVTIAEQRQFVRVGDAAAAGGDVVVRLHFYKFDSGCTCTPAALGCKKVGPQRARRKEER